jgi:hypothetical protein
MLQVTVWRITALDVNKRVVHSFASLVRNMLLWNMTDISKEAGAFATKILDDTRKCVTSAHMKENPKFSSKNVMDISVSSDGTWNKRGHTSNSGVGCVVNILTGLVIVLEIISKYFYSCVMVEKMMCMKVTYQNVHLQQWRWMLQTDFGGSLGKWGFGTLFSLMLV